VSHDTTSFLLTIIGAMLFGMPFGFVLISMGYEYIIGLALLLLIAIGIVLMSAGFHEFVIGGESP